MAPFHWLDLLLTFALLGSAHWFFGNVYEAVVYVPNMPLYFEGVMRTGRPMFVKGGAAPLHYYIPFGPLTVLLLWAALIIGKSLPAPLHNCLLAAALLLTAAGALTAYIVARLNLGLFYEVQTEAAVVTALLRRWTLLNYVRIGLVGASLSLAFVCFSRLHGS